MNGEWERSGSGEIDERWSVEDGEADSRPADHDGKVVDDADLERAERVRT